MSDKHSILHEFRRGAAHYFVNPITDVLVWLRIHPMVITILGLLIGIAGGVMIAFGLFWQAAIVILFSTVMDLFDGSIARKRNMVTLLGAVMDSIFDRLQEAAVLFGLIVYFVYYADGSSLLENQAPDQVAIILTFVAFFGSVMISYLRARAEGYGITGTSGLITRPERVIIVIICLIFGQPFILVLTLAIATTIGILLRSISIVRRIRHGENAKGPPNGESK